MCKSIPFLSLDGRIGFFLIFNQSEGDNLDTLLDNLIYKGDQGSLQKFKHEDKIFYCLEDMVVSNIYQNNIDHFQFIFQKFSTFKKNKYINKKYSIHKGEDKQNLNNLNNTTNNNSTSNKVINTNNTFDLELAKARSFSKYELDDINEFVQRKNFPERNKFKCFML